MRVFLFADEVSEASPVWMNTLWPVFNAIQSSIDTTFVPKPLQAGPRSRVLGRFSRWNDMREYGKGAREKILGQLEPNAPNILMVPAISTRDILWSSTLFPIWSSFSHRILHLFDQIIPENVPASHIEKFDLITCICEDLAAEYRSKFDIPVLFWPSHMDVLKYHSVNDYRPIDLIIVGRRQDELFKPLHRHFNQIGGNRVFLDFVTRTQTKIGGEEEFNLLFSTYSKSKCSVCFEPAYLPRFRGRSQLTGRWTHAWAAGCTVIGRAPTGTGVREQMDWDEATIDIPADPDGAIALVEKILADETRMRVRRRENVIQALRRHDTRYGLRNILEHLDLQLPKALVDGLDKLETLAQEFELAPGLSDSG